jgi:nitrate reductase gamma subunit
MFLSCDANMMHVIIGLFLILVIPWFDSVNFLEMKVSRIVLMVLCNDKVTE